MDRTEPVVPTPACHSRSVSPGRWRGPQRRKRWAAAATALFLLAAALDYWLFPLVCRPGEPSFNCGENGLWLRYRWYFGERDDRDIGFLAARLRAEQIRYAYFHVRQITPDGTLRYHRRAAARRLMAALHREAPSVKRIAWVYAGNVRQAVHVTRAVARGNPRCRVLLGLPTYGRGGLSHHAWAENLCMGLKGVREGLADPRANGSVFAGVALFADYTTQPEEWQTYRAWWLGAGQ